MTQAALETCPCCGAALEAGFAHRANGLSFVAPERLKSFVFTDEDLARSGLRRLLPSKAQYYRSYLCRGCKLYLVDYSTTFDHAKVKEMSRSMIELA